MFPYGKAVELWDVRIPEYKPEQIRGWVSGLNGEKVDRQLDTWVESGYLEPERKVNQDTGAEYIVYSLENSEEARNFVTTIFNRIRNEHNGQIQRYLKEHDKDDFEAFMDC